MQGIQVGLPLYKGCIEMYAESVMYRPSADEIVWGGEVHFIPGRAAGPVES
jgi:hypothetical protein